MDPGILNLWSPHLGLSVDLALLTAFLLGIIHGITPDEHTWPITFSYSVGSYSTKGGLRSGLLFSAAFTVQRALASEIAYFGFSAFAQVIKNVRYEFYVDLIVGAVMLVSGYYVLRRGRILHLFHSHSLSHTDNEPALRPIPTYMPLLHGFIAGWGSGAFALITYTVLAPAMTSPYLGFLPGFLFGAGTTVTQMVFGALIGTWMAHRHLAEDARIYVARAVAGRTLAWGGLAFVAVALLGLWFPRIGELQIHTGIHVHNLANLGVGFFLVIIIIFVVSVYSFVRSLRELKTGRALSQPK